MSLIMPGCALVFFSVMAIWSKNHVMFLLPAGASLGLGLYWYEVYETNMGLCISMLLVSYSLICLAFAFKLMFWRPPPPMD